MTTATSVCGEVTRVAGPVVVATGLPPRTSLYHVVHVGELRLPGEVIRLDGERTVIQVYEDTSGLTVGEPVVTTGEALQVELGPGLLGSIVDGTQRPLPELARRGDDPYAAPMIPRGVQLPALDRERRWTFVPAIAEGAEVEPGDLLGTVQETAALSHRVLVPDGLTGIVTGLEAAERTIAEPVVTIDDEPVPMLRHWPVREPLPVARRLDVEAPLVTGQRVIDTLFPLGRGGTATMPGGFGTGKTVLEHSLAKWAHADVVVYVACGERGNELTEVLEDFPSLVDPRTGTSLMDRTIIVANTSNMPVAAREASIYTGITIAEYYRDQGYDVALLADSTSRWGEALREVSSRLEEMPAEEGYPAYLSTRLAEFYERAGATVCRGREGRRGSVSIVGAVSPPGGDFSEPVTQYSLRLAGTFWALDTGLARRRHFPAVDWSRSYALYELGPWFDREVASDWEEQRARALELLQREEALLEIVQLLGADALAPRERVVLLTGQLLREDFLQQSSFDEADAYCPLGKQYWMLRVVLAAHDAMDAAVQRGVSVADVGASPLLVEIGRMRTWRPEDARRRATELATQIRANLEQL